MDKKIIPMFVVRELPNIKNNATHHNRTETNQKGRRTGASPAVLSRHCFGGSRSDLPPFTNFKIHKVMREPNGRCATCAARQPNAHELMLDVYLADSIPAITATLTDFFLEYMLNDVIDLADRHRAVFHYRVLTEALSGIDTLGKLHYQNQNAGRAAV